MHPSVIVFLTMSFILVSMHLREFAHASSTHQITHVVANSDDQERRNHPCSGSLTNGTIPTGDSLILCMVPTEEELREQLKDVGGLNKHYAAVTKEEAEKFVNLLPTPPPTSPRGEAKPFPIIWSHFVSTVSRNRKDVSRDTDLENNIISSKKTRCVKRGDRTDLGMFRLCSECQRISKLSPNRFPRYINEVSCSDETPSLKEDSLCCNNNQGMCIQRFLLIDFLVRTENYVEVPSPNPDKFPKAFKQVWEPYTQKIRSCCECQVW